MRRMLRAGRVAALVCAVGLVATPAAGQSQTTFTILTFTANPGGGVLVSWPAVPKARGYTLSRVKEEDGCCAWSVDLAPAQLSVADGLPVPGTYQYTLTAHVGRAGSASVQGTYYFAILDPPPPNRGRVTVITPCTPMKQIGGPPPASVQQHHTGKPTQVTLLWPRVPEAVVYKVERSPDRATWTELACLPATDRYYDQTRTDVDPSATIWPGRSYVYRVTAYQANGAAGWNSGDARLPNIYQPNGLRALRVGNQVTLCWSFGVSGVAPPGRFVITSSYGTNVHVADTSKCHVLLGVPDGLHTFRVGSAYRGAPAMLESPVAGRPSISVNVSP